MTCSQNDEISEVEVSFNTIISVKKKKNK